MDYSFDSREMEVMRQILAVTSVDNDTVRELRTLFAGPPTMEEITREILDEEGDEVTQHGLKCPWCGYEVWDDPEDTDSLGSVVVVDIAYRESSFRYIHANQQIVGYYNDEYSFEGGGYACESCYKRVSLPSYITEEGEN